MGWHILTVTRHGQGQRRRRDLHRIYDLFCCARLCGAITDLAEPIRQASDLLQEDAINNPDRKINKYIVLLTDGAPNDNDVPDECNRAVVQASTAKENGIQIFTIGYFTGGEIAKCNSPDFEGKSGAVFQLRRRELR